MSKEAYPIVLPKDSFSTVLEYLFPATDKSSLADLEKLRLIEPTVFNAALASLLVKLLKLKAKPSSADVTKYYQLMNQLGPVGKKVKQALSLGFEELAKWYTDNLANEYLIVQLSGDDALSDQIHDQLIEIFNSSLDRDFVYGVRRVVDATGMDKDIDDLIEGDSSGNHPKVAAYLLQLWQRQVGEGNAKQILEIKNNLRSDIFQQLLANEIPFVLSTKVIQKLQDEDRLEELIAYADYLDIELEELLQPAQAPKQNFKTWY